MSLSIQEIEAEILTLPEQEQQKFIDFAESLRLKLARRQVQSFLSKQEKHTTTETEGQRILNRLERAGLLGCMEGADENLSENYKEHLWGNE